LIDNTLENEEMSLKRHLSTQPWSFLPCFREILNVLCGYMVKVGLYMNAW